MFAATLLAIVAQPPHELAIDVASRIDQNALIRSISQLQSKKTRVTGTQGARDSRDWIAAELRGWGYWTFRQTFDLENVFEKNVWVDSENIVVSFGPSGPRLVVVAHMDSKAANHQAQAAELNWRWATSPAPGADDNASGCAALLEVARVLRGTKPKIGIDLVWAGGEEMAVVQPGFWMANIGAEPLVERYVTNGVPIVGALSVDMLLRSRPWGHAFRVYSDGRARSQHLTSAIEHAMWIVAPKATLKSIIDPSFAWSDHGSFWQREWGGVLFIEDDFHHERYHRETDWFDVNDPFYDPSQVTVGAKIISAAVVMLAY